MYMLGVNLATIFVLSCLWPPLLIELKSVHHEVEHIHKCLDCSLRERIPFSS